MQVQLMGVIIGGVIGISGGILTSVVHRLIEHTQRRNSITKITKAEVTAIKEKAERFLEGKSDLEELRSSTPLWTSLAPELGFLSVEQAVASRRAITLDMEMRKIGNQEKAKECKKACELALNALSYS